MRQKRKVNKSVISLNNKNKILFLISALVLLIFGASQFINKQEKQNKQSLVPTLINESLEKFTFEMPTSWQTYTTDTNLDINKLIVKTYPNIDPPTLTFKYPPSWRVFELDSYEYMYQSTIRSNFEIRKTHPKNTTHQVEGLLDDNISFALTFGVVSNNLPDFDTEFWGGGQIHDGGEKNVEINGIKTTIAYSKLNDPYPVEAIFHLSQNTVLLVRIEHQNTDQKCQTAYCKISADEINRILSSFIFNY